MATTTRVALVTGGMGGLGEAICLKMAALGYKVVTTHSPGNTKAKDWLDSMRGQGYAFSAYPCDVADWNSSVDCVKQVSTEQGPIDVLVNNAGIALKKDALDVTFEEWSHVLSVNLDGVWNCSQIFGRGMVARGRGSIINIGSMSGLIVNRPNNQPAYNASKAAVHHLTRSLAAEWAPYGVRVNAIAPGYVKTEMSPVDDPDLRRWWIEDAPMRRYAEVEEFGPAVVFLAGAASSFVTGSVLVMDGGYTLF